MLLHADPPRWLGGTRSPCAVLLDKHQNRCCEHIRRLVSVIPSGICQFTPVGHVAGANVGLRPGCMGVLRRAGEAGVPTHVISVNWSSELVRAALQQPACADTPGTNGHVHEQPKGMLTGRTWVVKCPCAAASVRPEAGLHLTRNEPEAATFAHWTQSTSSLRMLQVRTTA